jgi:pre-mRNA-processing factor 6
MLSRALQECPSSGILWSMAIWAEPRAARKTKGVDVLRKTKDHPLVVCAVARVLWADRVVGRAREWFGRATATDPDLGDIWGWWLKFERQHGTEVGDLLIQSQPSSVRCQFLRRYPGRIMVA